MIKCLLSLFRGCNRTYLIISFCVLVGRSSYQRRCCRRGSVIGMSGRRRWRGGRCETRAVRQRRGDVSVAGRPLHTGAKGLAGRCWLQLRTRVFVMGRHRRRRLGEWRAAACVARAGGATRLREPAKRTLARYAAHENFSRVAVNRWRHAGAEHKAAVQWVAYHSFRVHHTIGSSSLPTA